MTQPATTFDEYAYLEEQVEKAVEEGASKEEKSKDKDREDRHKDRKSRHRSRSRSRDRDRKDRKDRSRHRSRSRSRSRDRKDRRRYVVPPCRGRRIVPRRPQYDQPRVVIAACARVRCIMDAKLQRRLGLPRRGSAPLRFGARIKAGFRGVCGGTVRRRCWGCCVYDPHPHCR
jgi:hypothetical protein